MVSSDRSVPEVSGCPWRAKKNTRCSATGSIASRVGWRSALVVSAMANSSLPAITARDSSSKSPSTACTRSRELTRRHAPERHAERQFGGEHVGAEGDLGRLQAGEFLEVARQVAGLREDAAGVVDHQAAGLAGPQRLGAALVAAGRESTSLKPSADSKDSTRFNSAAGVRPSALAARVTSLAGNAADDV